MSTADSVTLSAIQLTSFTTSLFAAAGVPDDEATQIAESLVGSNLCGHESHGVVRVMEYVELLQRGELQASVPLDVLTETPAIVACDGNFGFGQVQMRRLIDRVVPKARELGVATGTLRNCGHVGRLAEWVEEIAVQGLAGLLTVNDNGVLKCVAPPGGAEPCISTNPIAVSAPLADEPIVVDASTSVVANGKIRVAQLAGQDVPDGWLLDANGQPTNNPNTRFADPSGSILPMGGYKGFGLGLLFDMLVGGLSGGHCPPAPDGTAECNNVLLVVFDPERFSGLSAFRSESQQLADFARNSRRQDDVTSIRLPGDRSRDLRNERQASGVPIDAGTWSELKRLATQLAVSVPVCDD